MGEVTNINILGTCISRDTFSVKPEIEKYKVLRYVNEFDPFYFNTQGMQIDKEKFDAYDVAPLISNFRKRCMYLDAVKKIMDFIKEADSDFLVIDSAICRLQTMRLGDACVAVSNYKEGFFNSLKDEGITDVGVVGAVLAVHGGGVGVDMCGAPEVSYLGVGVVGEGVGDETHVGVDEFD